MAEPRGPAAAAPRALADAGLEVDPGRIGRRRARWAWRRSRQIMIAGPVVGLLIVAAALAPLLAPADPNALNPRAKAQPPTLAHPLGTDEFGRASCGAGSSTARASRSWWACPASRSPPAWARSSAAPPRTPGSVESAIMRVMDGLLCFPPILLGIFVVTFLGPSLRNLILVIGVLYVPRFTRVVHASTLAIRELEYVESARALGASAARVVAGTILPNIVAPILVRRRSQRTTPSSARVRPLPGSRATASDSIVGTHGRAVRALHAALRPAAPLALGGDLTHRAGLQPAGRRSARPAGSESAAGDLTRRPTIRWRARAPRSVTGRS